MVLMSLADRLAYFLDFGSIHGIRYLGQRCGVSGKYAPAKVPHHILLGIVFHHSTRLFWLVLLLVSLMAMAIIFRTTLIAFGQDIIDVNIDTAYLHWTNTFPAVALCWARGNKNAPLDSWAVDYFDSRGIRKPDKYASDRILGEWHYDNLVAHCANTQILSLRAHAAGLSVPQSDHAGAIVAVLPDGQRFVRHRCEPNAQRTAAARLQRIHGQSHVSGASGGRLCGAVPLGAHRDGRLFCGQQFGIIVRS